MKLRLAMATACMCMLSACGGYHLVGQGKSSEAIPVEAQSLRVMLVGGQDADLLELTRKALQQRTGLPAWQADSQEGHVLEVRIEHEHEALEATSFDASGTTNQYRLRFSAQASVFYEGVEQWRSTMITVGGDVFAAGGAVSIEAQRASLAHSLRQDWVMKLEQQMYSGF